MRARARPPRPRGRNRHTSAGSRWRAPRRRPFRRGRAPPPGCSRGPGPRAPVRRDPPAREPPCDAVDAALHRVAQRQLFPVAEQFLLKANGGGADGADHVHCERMRIVELAFGYERVHEAPVVCLFGPDRLAGVDEPCRAPYGGNRPPPRRACSARATDPSRVEWIVDRHRGRHGIQRGCRSTSTCTCSSSMASTRSNRNGPAYTVAAPRPSLSSRGFAPPVPRKGQLISSHPREKTNRPRIGLRAGDQHGTRRSTGPTAPLGSTQPETPAPCSRYWAGKPGGHRAGRQHYARDRGSPNDVRLFNGLIWACPPSGRPKTQYLDSAGVRFDDGLSAAFDSSPMRLVSREPGTVHLGDVRRGSDVSYGER